MAASQRARTQVPAPQRSIVPTMPGIPAAAAVLIAVACTFLGFLIDANGGNDELTGSFDTLYVLGCLVAVLAVRYRGLFTTSVTPPLLLFVAVPLSYQQLSGRPTTSLKDILLNLAIPLVNRFPVMALATVLVAAVAAGRVYWRRREKAAESATNARGTSSWGRTATNRLRDRTEARSLSDPARRTRKPRSTGDDPDPTDHIPQMGRRSAEVADAPPRVGTPGKAARPDERSTRERRPNTRARPNTAAPRPEPEPNPAAARRRGEKQPPHPQPNVRYRERDSSRTERRRPEKNV